VVTLNPDFAEIHYFPAFEKMIEITDADRVQLKRTKIEETTSRRTSITFKVTAARPKS